MLRRYREMLLATWLVILPLAPALAKDKHHRAAIITAPSPGLDPASLYSPRALRRARLVLQLQLLALRKVRLACARAAVARHFPQPMIWRCFHDEVAPAGERESPAYERKHRQTQRAHDGH